MRCMQRTILTLILISAPTLFAQNPNPGEQMPIRLPIYPQLTKYLELKADQVLELGKVAVQWQQYLAMKTRRVADVESELRQITLAQTVDAAALGVRYAELEAICREARETDKKFQVDARKALTDVQRAKVSVLEQAYALLPVTGEADAAHLLDAPLPGLEMTAVAAAAAAKNYPGCRFTARPGRIMPVPLAGNPD